jgi:hypothetical protein
MRNEEGDRKEQGRWYHGREEFTLNMMVCSMKSSNSIAVTYKLPHARYTNKFER